MYGTQVIVARNLQRDDIYKSPHYNHTQYAVCEFATLGTCVSLSVVLLLSEGYEKGSRYFRAGV